MKYYQPEYYKNVDWFVSVLNQTFGINGENKLEMLIQAFEEAE